MPYPPIEELYNIAAKLGPVDTGVVNAAADELLERRKAMIMQDEEISLLKSVVENLHLLSTSNQT